MPEISQTPFWDQRQDQVQASAEREAARPDLRDVPENPPADEQDVERGREKLERILAK
jgi:hypothetical protein